jgi:AsmA protein
MPLERRHVRIPAAIALVAVAAFAVLWVGARTPFARGMIARAVSDAVGLPATVEALRLGFLPSLHLDIQGLAIAQPPGFGEEPLFEAGRIAVSLPWRRLLGMTDRLDTVSISQAMARLRVDANGTANWSALFAGPATSLKTDRPAEPAAPADPKGPAEPARWSIGAFELADGGVDYRDAATGAQWQLMGITAKATEIAPRAAFPLELQLGALATTQTMHFAAKGEARLDLDAGRYAANALEYRGWLGGEPLPLAGAELTGTLREASYETSAGEARLSGGRFEFAEVPGRFDGRLDFDEAALVADLEVATEPFGPRAPAIILGHPLPATRDPAAFESLQVAFRARMQDGELALDPFSGRLDDTNFEGRVIPGRRFVRASLDAIDLNRYLPPEPKPSGKPAAATPKATLESLISPLAKLDIDAEVRIGEARIAGALMRDAVLHVAPGGEGTR